jgi:2-methylfumaryl-CoA isomerase
MNDCLAGMQIVEVSAFIAVPLGGMTLGQLGADVIRIDPIAGNIDYRRWPLAPTGTSLYWTGLNKAKRSVRLSLDRPQGQELAAALIRAAGILLTNLPAQGWMEYAALSAQRADLIMLRLTGNYDGSTAVDYTVNCASGFPMATGGGEAPVNHVLPAWDIAAGLYAATGLLAAERQRRLRGIGCDISLALSDAMLASVANLGYVADVQINATVRPPLGNYLYGAFGRDFLTADGRRVMITAISNRQWRAIGTATGLAEKLALIGTVMEVDLNDEGGRFEAREAICAVLGQWCARHTLLEIEIAFSGTGVLWGPYQDFGQLVHQDRRCSTANPLFAKVAQPGVGEVLMPGSPLGFSANPRQPPHPAPLLGADTDAVLAEVLGLSAAQIGRLHDTQVIAGAMT